MSDTFPQRRQNGQLSSPSTTSPTASTTSVTVQKSHDLSSGDVAGIGVGCAVAGALIAAVIFLLMSLSSKNRRHKRHPYFSRGNRGDRRPHHDDKEDTIVTISIPENSSAAVVQNHLPAPAEEHGITGDFSKIHDKIAGHVQGYYQSTGSLKDPSVIEKIGGILGLEAGSELHSRLPSLLTEPTTRVPILRSVLAAIIIPKIDPASDPRDSFLPPEVAGSIHLTMYKLDYNDHVRMAFLSKHHTLTAFLLAPGYSANPSSLSQAIGATDPRAPAISSALNFADSLLRAFSSAQSDDEDRARRRNLEEIMKRAARFGYVLVSQPTLWKFDGKAGAIESATLTLWPGMVQVTDEEGRVLRSGASVGRMAVEAVRARF